MTLLKMANKINIQANYNDDSDEESIVETNSDKESENDDNIADTNPESNSEDDDNNSVKGDTDPENEDTDPQNEDTDPQNEDNSENEDIKSENESDSSENESDKFDIEDTLGANAAWADSISKILRTKKPKNKRTLVLSKAKKLTDIVKKDKPEQLGFKIDGEIKDEKPDSEQLTKLIETSVEPPRKKRKELPTIRVKPNILDKDRERTLSKIATRGVVQLFNSVRTQQKDINAKLEEAGPLERKRENALKSIDKRAFLDVLMQKKSQPVDGNVKNEIKYESKQSTWNVLRDDFMIGAKLKDWDKETEEDEDDEVDVDEMGAMSDSD